MDPGFPPALHDAFARVDEVRIRPRGSSRRGVPIWVVVADGAVHIRSYKGRTAQWFASATAAGTAEIEVDGQFLAVRLTAATSPAAIAAVSAAFLAKYRASPYAAAMVLPDVLDTTLRVTPAA